MNLCRILSLSITLCIGLLFAASAEAFTTTLIDFNDSQNPGFGWNTLNQAQHHTTVPLVFDDGTASGVSIFLPSFSDSANAGWNPAVALPSWAPNAAANDYSTFNGFCCDGGTESVHFLLSNLDPGRLYQFDVIASRNLDRVQDLTITHAGGVDSLLDWNTQTDGWMAGQVLHSNILRPDGANKIRLEFRRHGTSGAFNAMRITSLPEPKSLALMTFGLVGLAICGGRDRR